MNLAAIILVGGQSTRMGKDKAEVCYHGIPLLDHCKKIIQSACMNDIFVSGKEGIQDQIKNLGPLGGVYSCLEHLQNYDQLLFIPVDMPLITNKILMHLMNQGFEDCVHYKNFNMPFVIKNNQKTRKTIKQMIASKNLAVYQLFNRLNTKEIAMDKSLDIKQEYFENINTPEQLASINQ